MKYITIFTIGISLCIGFSNCEAKGAQNIKDMHETAWTTPTMEDNSILLGIQSKIESAYLTSYEEGTVDDLLEVYYDLQEIADGSTEHIATYWLAYTKYYIAILQYYKIDDKKKSENNVNEAIELLTSVSNLDSEYYALISIVRGFSAQFHTISELKEISSMSRIAAEESLRLDSLNARGHYAMASSDFYIPEIYGGGKLVEESLLTSLRLPAQKIKNDYLPSWGQDLSYKLLIEYYVRKDKDDLAKSYLESFKTEFPNSYFIGQLETLIQN